MEQSTSITQESTHNSDHTRDARLAAVETRQKLRDDHVDRRFDDMGKEFLSLDRRVSNQISELNGKIDVGFRSLTEELRKDRDHSEGRVAKMYEDWRAERESESKKPSTIKVTMLLSFMGVVLPTLTIAGGVIMLVVNPIKEQLDTHVKSGPHWNGEGKVALLDERTAINSAAVRAELDANARTLEKLQEQRVIDAERWGRIRTTDAWVKKNLERLNGKQSDQHSPPPPIDEAGD